jgi:hypothetical protein
MTTTTDRAGYIAGLRTLADALANDPDLVLPWDGSEHSSISIFTQTKAEIAAYARLMGKASKKVNDSESYGFQLRGLLHGVNLLVYAPRSEVCERVVTGTREVTTTVPDPDALALVPTITTTSTVEDVTWICSPLLAPTAA